MKYSIEDSLAKLIAGEDIDSVLFRLAPEGADNLCQLFLSAIDAEHFKIAVNILEKVDLAQRQAMIAAGDYRAFKKSIPNGDAEITRIILRDVSEEQRKAMIYAGPFGAFIQAVLNGNVAMAEVLLDACSSEEMRQEMIACSNYEPLRLSTEKGHAGITKMLLTRVDSARKKEMVANNKFVSFVFAAAAGDHESVEEFLKLFDDEPLQKQAMINARDFSAFPAAVQKGHFEVAKVIMRQFSDEGQKEIIERNSKLFSLTPLSKGCEMAKMFLDKITNPEQKWAMFADDDFRIFPLSIQQKNIELFQMLFEQMSQGQRQTMIAADQYNVLRTAIKCGNIELFQMLLGQMNQAQQQAMIAANNFQVFSDLVDGRHIAIAIGFLRKVGLEERHKMIADKDFKIFSKIAASNDLAAISEFFDLVSSVQMEEMITHNYFRILFDTISQNNFEMAIRILREASPKTKDLLSVYQDFKIVKIIFERGNIKALNEFFDLLSFEQKQSVIAGNDSNSEIFHDAVRNAVDYPKKGEINERSLAMAIKMLQEAGPDLRLQILAKDNCKIVNVAVAVASKSGNFSELNKLFNLMPFERKRSMNAYVFKAFREAISEEFLAMANKLLEEVDPSKKQIMVGVINEFAGASEEMKAIVKFPPLPPKEFRDIPDYEESKKSLALQVMQKVYLETVDQIKSSQASADLSEWQKKIAEKIARRVGSYILENDDAIKEAVELYKIIRVEGGGERPFDPKSGGNINNLSDDAFGLILKSIVPSFDKIHVSFLEGEIRGYLEKDALKEDVDALKKALDTLQKDVNIANSVAIEILGACRLTVQGILERDEPKKISVVVAPAISVAPTTVAELALSQVLRPRGG